MTLTSALIITAQTSTAAAQDSATPQHWPPLSGTNTAPTSDHSQDQAVIVSIEDYVFAQDIPGAHQNAVAWYTYLRHGLRVPIQNINLLKDSEATREEITHALERAVSRQAQGGRLWFVFIGHGAPSKDGQEGLLVGSDAQQNPRSLYARSVPTSTIARLAERGAQQTTFLVLDACFSGQSSTGAPLVQGLQPLVPTQAPIRQDAPSTKTIILTAAKSNQFAGPLPRSKRPAFSYLVLGALQGWADLNKDQHITPDEIHHYTRHVLSTLVTDRSQTPELHASSPTHQPILTLSRANPGPDLDAIRLGRPWKPPTAAPKLSTSCPKGMTFQKSSNTCVPFVSKACPPGMAFQADIGCTPKIVRAKVAKKSPPKPTANAHSGDEQRQGIFKRTQCKDGPDCFRTAQRLAEPEAQLTHFKLSCQQGHAPGCLSVATLYAEDEVEDDAKFEKAVYFYSLGCSLESAESCNHLAWHYNNALGTEYSPASALKFYTKACDHGFQDSCDTLEVNEDDLKAEIEDEAQRRAEEARLREEEAQAAAEEEADHKAFVANLDPKFRDEPTDTDAPSSAAPTVNSAQDTANTSNTAGTVMTLGAWTLGLGGAATLVAGGTLVESAWEAQDQSALSNGWSLVTLGGVMVGGGLILGLLAPDDPPPAQAQSSGLQLLISPQSIGVGGAF